MTLSTPGTHINADLTIQGGSSGTVDFSSSPVLASKVSGSESYTRRILLKFDTQNYIPANAVIQSAHLYLVLNHAESGENRPLTAYHVTKSFVKYEANWVYFRNGQPWSTRGGDLGPSFSTTYVGNAEGSTYKFDMTAMLQRTVNGEFGSRYLRLALVDTGGVSSGNYKEFHSTRASNTALRPRLVVTYGTSTTSTTTSTTTQPAPAPSTSTGTTLRVMQWNVKKTKGSDGLCNPGRVADAIAAQNPDVVSLNEVNFFSGECAWNFDMADHLESLLQQRTGVQWYRQIVNVYGGTSGYGNVLLSRHAPTSQGYTLLSYQRGVAQMTIVVNGRYVNLFSTHVEYYTSSWRTTQITEAVRWMSGFSEPRIMMGDFNTWPGTSDYNIIAQPYQDAWTAAQAAGTASAFNGSGNTSGGSRFDYVFYSRVAALSLQSVTVPDTRINGVYPSDHHPVVAVFKIN
ncbi:MAG TPA: endonuclease/exonuclease/phosphatase family protein [Vicinamibacterales bacterium]|nr:endonuclease/exonuclease/phosphatase family protein [Vicinamibacterales bacterium]